MNAKNIAQTPKNLDNNKIIEEAAKKLEKFEKGQKRAEKYFQDRDKLERIFGKIETNLKEKIQLEKKIKLGFCNNTLDQIQLLLQSLSGLNGDVLKQISEKQITVNKEVQTDQDDSKILRDNFQILEKENEKIKQKIQKYKNEQEALSSEVNSLKELNLKLQKENTDLNQNLEEMTKNKNKLESKIKIDVKKIESQNSEISKNEGIIKEYHEMKNLMAEKFQVEREKLEIEEKRKKNILEFFKGDIKVLVYLKVFDKVTEFLTPKDIYSVKLSNSTLHNEIERNPNCIKHYYENIVKLQNRKINELNSFDIKKEYIAQDCEIEKLIVDYVKNKKQPGRDLKNIILKAISFINKEVKPALGIKVVNSQSSTPKTNNTNQPGAYNTGFLNGISSYFGSSLFGSNQNGDKKPSGNNSGVHSANNGTPNKESPSVITSGNNSRTMSIAITGDNISEIDKYDKFVISENVPSHEIPDFEYISSEEIRSLLKRFLKSSFSTEKFSAFINELCNEYSEFLFFSYKSYCEIKDLEIIKNTLNERYRRYFKMASSLEKTLVESNKNVENVNASIKKISSFKQDKAIGQIYETLNTYEKKIELMTDREGTLSTEFELFRDIYTKEILNLRYDLDDVITQRDLFRNSLIEIKGLFKNINEKGEIV